MKIEKRIEKLIKERIKIFTEDIPELWYEAAELNYKMYSDIELIEDAMSENFTLDEIKKYSKEIDKDIRIKMNEIFALIRTQKKQLQSLIKSYAN